MRRVLVLLGLCCAALVLGLAAPVQAADRPADAAAKLPKLVGTVTPMRSKLGSRATDADRVAEAANALDALFGNKRYCDTHTARRWLLNLHLLAGDPGERPRTDRLGTNERVPGLRKLIDRDEAKFTDYRIRCAGREAGSRDANVPDPYAAEPKRLPACPPGAYGCPLPGQTCPDGGDYADCRRYPPQPLCNDNEQDCPVNPPCAEAGDCVTNPEAPLYTGGLQQVF
jgi:hypothetical protein